MIEIDAELCKDCKLCISVCPHRLIESSDRMNQKGYYPASFVEKHLKKEGRKC
ncbi:MAG TPA: 4Fe-4S binding protein, partial [Thermodesulfobacteriota bacterium]|nr:4Fe-4S binding protein [Thermodesulfobacteriota bacterium]